MIIKRILNATRVLGKSQGFIPLPLRDEILNLSGQEVPAMTTAWEPTPAELVTLLNGGTVYLRLLGTQWPPCQLWVEDNIDRRSDEAFT